MPFGKYRGEDICDIPIDYLRWLIRNVQLRDENLRREIEEETGLEAPEVFPESTWRKKASGGTSQAAPPTKKIRSELIDAVVRWRGRMARTYHPDRGGDSEVMKAINDAADLLFETIEEVLPE